MRNKEQIHNSTLASYAVMKAMTDSNEYRDSYEILADFIRYLIVDRKWRSFTITEINAELQSEFGFDNIPVPTIRTALKKISECKKNGDEYILPKGTSFKVDAFQRAKEASSSHSVSIVSRLFDYAKLNNGPSINFERLEDAFIKYLLDDAATIDSKYADIISKFILNNENDDAFKAQLGQIREGSILFCGLAYNINELGSITSDLTLFLDTEVLFNIAGYNGVLYQKVAEDFLSQVKIANLRRELIHLRYFAEVKKEVEDFFASAESIIKGSIVFRPSTAMKAIINGCETVGDVRNKEADFFYLLESKYGIVLDEKKSYYTEEDFKYNLEMLPDGFQNDERSAEAIKFISHINKLRKGESSFEYTKSKYLLITETRRVQEISNAMKFSNTACGFVLPTSTITNLLWFKLGSGFSKKDYPVNTDASYKARIILSSEIANRASRLYEETKKQYEAGEINKDQVVSRILLMREKYHAPDEVTVDNIDDLLDISPEYITKYEEGLNENAAQLKEKQKLIAQLEAEIETGDAKNSLLREQLAIAANEGLSHKAIIARQEKTIQNQTAELERFRAEEAKRLTKRDRQRHICIFIRRLFLYVVIAAVVVAGINLLLEKIAPTLKSSIKDVVEAAGVCIFIINGIKRAWMKSFGQSNDEKDKSN